MPRPNGSRMAIRLAGKTRGHMSRAALSGGRMRRCSGNRRSARGLPARLHLLSRPVVHDRPASSRFRELAHKMQACFRQAGALFDPPFKTVAVPYQGKILPGYFYNSSTRRATSSHACHRRRSRRSLRTSTSSLRPLP